uniref:Regulator of telomere elongation helicase 1 n=1 Tax=Cyprinus carpio carpio TaxID=630221 RepID=A0A9J8BER1_CYPCA
MPLIKLRGVSVDFPFTPYPCQEDYMNKVIECLQNKVNGVLESPTGTGKTLCLLCSALGWREHFKDTISARKIAERMGGAELFPDRAMSSWGTAATDGDTPTYYTDIPKIIYASRTHSQLTQVISELKNTSYRSDIVHDVYQIVCSCRVCPYYLSRTLKQHADVIFMPYNYLLDPKSRRAHNIELKGAVVIFDEAHNVEKMCEESTSFDLTPYDLISAIEAVDRLLREQYHACGVVWNPFFSIKKNIFLNAQLINLTEVLMDLESSINGFEMPANNQGITKPGSFIYELFQTAHVNSETKTAVVEAMEQITGYLAGRPGVFLNTSGLQKVADIIQVRIIVFHFQSLLLLPESVSHQVHIHPDTSNFKKKQVTDVWASSSTKKQGNVLSYWCFSPGFSMQELLRQEVRSIILTSGTLSPLSSFTCEMQIPFPVSLENPHVIQRDQIFVSVIEKGPDGVQLSTAFNRRFVPENMSSMGNTLVNLARVVPHGLLVFFPSYPVMDKTLEFWRVIDGYYDKVNDPNSNGGSFFAVCRGKASEGLDFADTYGRGVVITGLPFPPRMDPRVVLKMQYLDEMCKNKISGVKYLSGQEWYRQQASRAVNQAIGRVIRHREDYGAIFLCDHRFKGTEARNQLPSWVRPYVKIYDGFGTMVRDAAQFFRTAQKTASSSCPAKSVWLSDTSQKAKTLDSHVPSLKRRKLGELTSIPAFFWPFNEASRLSTLSLQHDKRLDDESRGGKRKIKVVQERKTVASCTAKTGKAFMMELRRCLSHENFKLIMEALQSYKTSDDLSDLLAIVTEPLIQDHNTHCLLRGLYQFIRPHHKKEFDERCLELTGEGCGYKQEHSLSREERDALRLNTGNIRFLSTKSEMSSVNPPSEQLNQGGSHLLSGGDSNSGGIPQTSIKEGLSCSSLLSDIKLAIGAEKTKQMFLALQAYKTSNNYEQMVSTVVSLLTERDEDIALLERLSVLIRPQHRKQFSELLKSLTGNDSVANQDSDMGSSQLNQGILSSPLSAGKTQSKISSFFS